MESGKTSWVLLFTHFYIKRLLLPSNPFLEAKTFSRVTSEREKRSSKEAGKAESRVNPVNPKSSQNSWYHLAKKALWNLYTEIDIPAVCWGFPGTWLLPLNREFSLQKQPPEPKPILKIFKTKIKLYYTGLLLLGHCECFRPVLSATPYCPSLPYFEKITELVSLPEKLWVRWWRPTEEFTAAVNYKTWHPQPEGTWV